MSWLAFTTEPAHLGGGWLASTVPGLGASGAAIKAASTSGQHGAGALINDALDDASEYWWTVATPPASGTLAITEDGQAVLTVPADGFYTWAYDLREDGVVVASGVPVAVLVGVAATAVAVAVPEGVDDQVAARVSLSVAQSAAVRVALVDGPDDVVAAALQVGAAQAVAVAVQLVDGGDDVTAVRMAVGQPAHLPGAVMLFKVPPEWRLWPMH